MIEFPEQTEFNVMDIKKKTFTIGHVLLNKVGYIPTKLFFRINSYRNRKVNINTDIKKRIPNVIYSWTKDRGDEWTDIFYIRTQQKVIEMYHTSTDIWCEIH